MFSVVTLMVLVTTFLPPPLLKLLFPSKPSVSPQVSPEGIEDLVAEAGSVEKTVLQVRAASSTRHARIVNPVSPTAPAHWIVLRPRYHWCRRR